MYLQFRRNEVQRRHPVTIDTECSSLGINRFLSGGMTSSDFVCSKKYEEKKTTETGTSFFNVMSQQISAAFSKDPTSLNIKSSMVRDLQSYVSQAPTINFGVIPGVSKTGRSLVRLQNAHQKEVQTSSPIRTPTVRHNLNKKSRLAKI